MGHLNEQSLVGNGPLTNGSKPSEYKPLRLVSKKHPHIGKTEQVTLFHTIEQLATLESTLHFIVEGVKSKATDIAFFCREYWGSSASMAQLSLDELAWGDPLGLQVRRACALESLSMAALSQVSSGTMHDVPVAMRLKLRKLIYHLHANCLVLLDLARRRWEREGKDRGGGSERMRLHCPQIIDFNFLIEVGRYCQHLDGEHSMALAKNCEAIASNLRSICESGPTSQQPEPEHSAAQDILRAVRGRLQGEVPLERLRAKAVRDDMLAILSFRPLLKDGSGSVDCPWPARDPYTRFGASRFAADGRPIFFEPHAPVIADLDGDQFLPRRSSASSPDFYTLVLDLDETLVHTPPSANSFRVRPGATQFLQKMSALGFELVIFTTATQDYADTIIDQIDPRGLIKSRLYRQHTLPWGPVHIKDLSRLGRDLQRTLIIDNIAENFMLQPQNGITIQDWFEDPQDQALYNLTPLLEELATTCAQVPDILSKYAEQIPVWAGLSESQKGKAPVFQSQPQAPRAMGEQVAAGAMPFAVTTVTYAPVVMQIQPWSFVSASTSAAPVPALAPAQSQAMFQATMQTAPASARTEPAAVQAVVAPAPAAAAVSEALPNHDKGAAKARRTIRNARLDRADLTKPANNS